jgi:hypothetical protein
MSHPDSRQQRQHVAAWQILYTCTASILFTHSVTPSNGIFYNFLV